MEIGQVASAVAGAVPGSDPATFDTATGPGLLLGRDSVKDVLRFLRDDPEQSYEMLIDVTCVDREATEGVFEVIYVLRSLSNGTSLVCKTRIPAEDPSISTVSDLWASANWGEREVWDMFGIRFEGHPDLRRILMYEEFQGHPLRKSYAYNDRQPLVPERDPITDPWPKKR